MSAKILQNSIRIRRTPFSDRVENSGLTSVTVYNRMLLPTVFRSLEEDYYHLKNAVQLWDVSVQRQVEICGKDSSKLLKMLTPRNLSDMKPNQCFYIPMVNRNGGMVNDPVLVKLEEDRYWISIADSDVLLWVSGIVSGLDLDVSVFEPDVFPLAIQGPKSRKLMSIIFGSSIEKMKYFDLKEFSFNNHTLKIARSGWSKQGGYEIYVEGYKYALDLWDELMSNGKDLDVRAGCPNQIERIESGFLSYGSDMTIENSPFECDLGRFCGPEIELSCIGAKALMKEKLEGPKKIIRYLQIDGPKLDPINKPFMLVDRNSKVGSVSSCTFSPDFNINVAIGMVDTNYLKNNDQVEALIGDQKRITKIMDKPLNRKLRAFSD